MNLDNDVMPTILVRLADATDSKDVFEWRNDELTRTMSHVGDVVEWQQHCAWFDSALQSEHRILMICEDSAGEKLSLVRFDVTNEKSVVSINLNPHQRGKGLAKPCLSRAIEFLSQHNQAVTTLIAEIKEINIASQKAFLGIGFVKSEIHDGFSYYEMTLDGQNQNDNSVRKNHTNNNTSTAPL